MALEEFLICSECRDEIELFGSDWHECPNCNGHYEEGGIECCQGCTKCQVCSGWFSEDDWCKECQNCKKCCECEDDFWEEEGGEEVENGV